MPDSKHNFGIVGFAVMRSNFLMNMADHGFAVFGCDKTQKVVSIAARNNFPGAGLMSSVNYFNAYRRKLLQPHLGSRRFF